MQKEGIVVGFENLEVWKESCRLAVEIYDALKDCKDYGLRDQMQRAGVSIPSNIAEGAERQSVKEFCQFLYIAKGSSAELRTQLYIAARIGVISNEKCTEFTSRCKSIAGQIQKLISSLEYSRG